MKRNIVLTILIVLALVVGAAGIGFVGFRAGAAYGISQSPQVAEALQNLPEGGQVRPGDAYGFGPGFGMRPFGGHYGWGHRGFGWGWGSGFGFLGCLFPLFGLFLLFALFRFIFRPWGWRHGWHGGPWMKEGMPPHFEEWHKRAHGQTPPADQPPSTSG
ncbi:MAG TPA: hypothetical protein VJ020_09445 [Anaerolineales bacterium]|nr:hypothetical protein [Anaerolineales bacterium]